MTNFAIIMLVFGFTIVLAGFSIYRGHDGLLWRGYYKKRSKAYLKYLGRATMLIGLVTMISGSTGFFFEEGSIIPVILLLAGIALTFYIYIKKNGDGAEL